MISQFNAFYDIDDHFHQYLFRYHATLLMEFAIFINEKLHIIIRERSVFRLSTVNCIPTCINKGIR
ncbi:MAG: hypothetical protein ACW98X_15255 [Promethearchaeota archaeon]